MRKFVLHITVFIILSVSSILYILSLADGHSDAYYLKLTSTQKPNLILGTSKAAQGLQPKIINKILHRDLYNYAFAVDSSPYGPVYFNRIKEKLNETGNDHVFIVTVDAWSICSTNNDPNNVELFRENKTYLNNDYNKNQGINLKYFLKYFEREYYTILTKSSPGFLHNDGWLETTLDENENERRTAFTLKNYTSNEKLYRFSNTRLLYLEKITDYLKKFGKVYIVRMPVSSELNTIEENLLPDFNNKLIPVIKKSDGYLDLSQKIENLQFTDGVHLNKKSGAKVSKLIANYIVQRDN